MGLSADTASFAVEATLGGNTLNFFMPAGISAGETILTVDGNASIVASPVNLYLDGGNDLSALQETQSIKLLHAGGALTANPSYSDVILKLGVSLIDTSRVFSIAAASQDLTATLKSTYVPPLPPPHHLHPRLLPAPRPPTSPGPARPTETGTS